MKKKTSVEKTISFPDQLEQLEKFLKKLEKESGMIDDHGAVIIGRRDRQPSE